MNPFYYFINIANVLKQIKKQKVLSKRKCKNIINRTCHNMFEMLTCTEQLSILYTILSHFYFDRKIIELSIRIKQDFFKNSYASMYVIHIIINIRINFDYFTGYCILHRLNFS